MGTNTGIGIGIGIPFKNNALGGDRPYLPPELKARLIGVWDNYGKKNTDADRNIIKNKIPNAGGDLEILNAAYKLNSGFGEYKVDFLDWTINSPFINERTSFTFSSFNNTNNDIITVYQRVPAVVQSFKIKAKLRGKVLYRYYVNKGDTISVSYYEVKEGINILPDSVDPTSVNGKVGFVLKELSSIKVEQIPNLEGAFVTDGVNDLIISQKTVKEMIGDNDEITVISMVYYINTDVPARISITNDVRGMTAEDKSSQVFARNGVKIEGVGKLGIYGWSKKGTSTTVYPYFNILGDKTDYESSANYGLADDAKFCPVGEPSLRFMSKQAHYWSFMVIGKLTEDEINLIIGNYNLDRSLKPDILCNIGKQGITNDNHADFNDKLIDYSGNGRDIQMYNLAWKGGSGIAAKQYETFKDWTSEFSSTSIIKQIDEFTRIVESSTNGYWISRIRRDSDLDKVYSPINVYLYQDNNFLVHECKYEVDGVKYAIPINEPVGKGYHKLEMYTKDRYTELPENAENVVLSEWYFPKSTKGSIKYSIIPSCKGGILLDGINDFGKVIGMPVYKDYTIVVDYERISGIEQAWAESLISKSYIANQGAFVLMETNGTAKHSYSFGAYTTFNKDDSTRTLLYQSKYKCGDVDLNAGTGIDGDTLWLGTYRDNYSSFFNGAIYSLMSFPYSMSEFLIERQLKKHKLGTLYPNMVEFRPIINSNVKWDTIEIWQASKPLYRPALGTNETGSYIIKDSTIGIYVKPFVGQKVSKIVYNGTSYTDLKANNNGFYYITVPVTKSPQKIGITIEQDENYVLFNPVITSNVEYHKLDFYLNNYQKRINIGDYIPKGACLRANFYLKNNVDELTVFTFNGVNIGYRRSSVDDTAFNTGYIYNYDSPQEVNITIDEYIRYEEIVQPYPVIFQITDRNTNQRYSWGDKIKVGSSIRLSQGEKPNLLSGLYSIQSYEYEGETYSYNQLTNLNIILTKQSISLSCNKTWLLDDNEPKCILSPRLLRIPNSSYKILGYIPDISGHGNHGKINNSAYEGMSGVNGYPVVFGENKTWANKSSGYITSITSNTIHITNVLNAGLALLYSYVKYNGNLQNIKEIPPFKIEIKGLEGRSKFIYKYLATSDATKETNLYLGNGTHELPKSFLPTEALINNAVVGFSISPIEEGVTNFLSDITIKVLSEYEGAYCLDGVDDFVTIPTIVGGKQVLMKVNWQNKTGLLYDQRKNGSSIDVFAILNVNSNNSIAYNSRNTDGETYIDGILNKNIVCPQLYKITHSITIINQLANKEEVISPTIGSDTTHKAYFSQMALYDFMLFDDISIDDKIKELNEYVGIEAKVELPPYYWDAYGKTNLDADKATIQQRGVAIGGYDLTNYNHAYEGMSGYNGYPVVFGANKTWESLSGVYGYTSDVTNTTIHVTHTEHTGNGLLFSYVKKDGALANIKEIPAFRVTVKGLEGNSKFGYRYLATEDATEETLVYLGNGTHELAKSFAPTEALLDLTRNVWVGIFITPMVEGEVVFDCDITIEVLPEYENGLAYDGITDYSKNANIPVLTDYTYIYKRTIINIPTNAATLLKGADKTNGGAFIADYGNKWQFNFGQYNIIQGIADGINWQTVNSFNGTSINKGENTDDSGITVAKFSNGYTSMVFYKLILYPKTISLLEINFLKNLMEKDEIIDLNNPIFIKNE